MWKTFEVGTLLNAKFVASLRNFAPIVTIMVTIKGIYRAQDRTGATNVLESQLSASPVK